MRYREILFLLTVWVACSQPYEQGERSFSVHCAPCHMDDGSGLAGVIPPLAGSKLLVTSPEILPCIIRNGMEGPIIVLGKTYDRPMPGIRTLSETETANILNYMQYRWGDPNRFHLPQEVLHKWDSCGSAPVRLPPFGPPSG